LCLDFVNSEWYDGFGRLEDRLQSPEWLSDLLERWHLPDLDPPGDTTKRKLLELRSLLRRIVETAHQEPPVIQGDLDRLNRFMAVPSYRQLARGDHDYRLEVVPHRVGWDWIAAEIAASTADLLSNHDLRRLKVCDNPGCRWVFYDESRNRNRRWCESTSCGNRFKVRRYRERQRIGVGNPTRRRPG